MAVDARSFGSRHPFILLFLLFLLFFPVRRYAFGGGLPVEPEPYRLVLALFLVLTLLTCLAGATMPFRHTGFDLPIYALLTVLLLSLVFNLDRAVRVRPGRGGCRRGVWGAVLTFYIFVAVIRTYGDAARVLTIIVIGCSILGFFAVIEARNGWDPFSEFTRVIPGINLKEYRVDSRGGAIRAQTSAQHPISLGALFAMVIPISLVFASYRGRRWLIATGLMLVGMVAANSRTSIIMFAVAMIVLAALRWRLVVRLLPWALVAVACVHFAMPGALGSLKNSFFPHGGLVAEQRESAGSRGSGRVADIGPALVKFRERPIVGYGMGTAVSEVGPRNNSPIFDDQWLASLLDSGLLGVGILVWIFSRFIRRTVSAAGEVDGEAGSILSALAAGVAAYAVGMFFYDAFAFVQVTTVMFIYLALGSALVVCPSAVFASSRKTRGPQPRRRSEASYLREHKPSSEQSGRFERNDDLATFTGWRCGGVVRLATARDGGEGWLIPCGDE